MRQLFVDTETTGLSAADGDRVLEIACVEMIDRRVTGRQFHQYLNPDRDSHPEALRIHGLSREFLMGKPQFADIAEEFLQFIQEGESEIIIHNAAFDCAFIDAELQRAQQPTIGALSLQITDTWLMFKRLYPGQQSSLDALCRRFGVDNSNRSLHGALLDAQLLAEVYIGLTRGQNSLLGEMHESQEGAQSAQQDLSQYKLPILYASAEELDAHTSIMAKIKK